MKAILTSFIIILVSSNLLEGQNIGIGTTNPQAKLHIKAPQGAVTAFYDGFNEGVINPAYQVGDRNWQIITDDPPVGTYGVGAPNSFKRNEIAILEFVVNTPVGKDIQISFSALHNDPDSKIYFTVVKPGGLYYVDHNPTWKNYNTNFIATASESVIKFRLEADQDVQFPETWLDEINVTYSPDPALMIDDGTQMSGGILQSDAFGNTSWVDLRSEIDQQVGGATQTLLFDYDLNVLNIENGNGQRIAGLSNNQLKKLSLKSDSLVASPGMHLKFPGAQASESNMHYDGDQGSFTWGIKPIDNNYSDAPNSVRWGYRNQVNGEYGSVWGQNNILLNTGFNATVFGAGNNIGGFGSSAWGLNNTISADSLATVWGKGNTVSGKFGTAWGRKNVASGDFSTAVGIKSIASGILSFASGYEALASGAYSTSVGNYASAPSFGEISIGFYNRVLYPNSTTTWDLDDMLFSIGNGYGYTYGNNALSILKRGYVGINTASPDYYLDIAFDKSGYQGIRIENKYNGALKSGAMLRFEGEDQTIYFNGRKNNDFFELRHDSDTKKLYFEEDGGKILTITSGRRIGINEANPEFDLHLSDNSAAKPSSSSWMVASDRRLKQDIRPFRGGLDLVEKINPVWFTYNGRANMPRETAVGTIAQELEKVAPYMVTDWDRDGESYKAVDYGAMDFVLINSIKELSKQNKELRSEVDELKALVKALLELKEANGK